MTFPRLLLRLLLGRRSPRAAGELVVRGPARPVTIRRDRWGVPAVAAETDADAAFGLGFCHGQDRAFQLDFLLRVGRGTLAELAGPKALPADRVSRRVGFRRAADGMFAACTADVREALAAYAAGVNAGATDGLPRPPHEYAILGGERTPWEPADVLASLLLQTFLIPTNWDAELARLRLLRADGPDAVRALDPAGVEPSGPREGDTGSPARGPLAADLNAFLDLVPRGAGSNNWAVAGGRTASGRPVLASDPHLAPSAPPIWYLAHVRTPDWAVSGATFAGGPVFPIGHNGFAAWGVTAALSDNTDLFLETLGPDGTSTREADGSFRPADVRREVIRVKGRPDEAETVLVTPRGPLLTPPGPGADTLSLRAVWLQPLPVRGFFAAPRARSFAEFREAFAEWPVMPLNVLYADEVGTVGWQLAGQIPRRKSGTGTLPLPADAPGVGWEDELVPFAAMPFAENPPAGFVATANDPPPVPPGGPFVGADYVDPYRGAAIREELAKRTDWDVPACLTLQTDVRSRPWEEMRDAVFAAPPNDADAGRALALLREWNGHVTEDSAAAAVFELFVAGMCVRVAKAKAPAGWRYALGELGPGVPPVGLFADRRVAHLARLLRDQPAGWFPRPWPAEVAAALGDAVRQLRAGAGPGPAFWGWGHLRPLVLKHPLFHKARGLNRAFDVGPVPCGGDGNTVMQAGAAPLDPLAPTHNMPGLRAAFDCGAWQNSRFVLAGGQSGNPCSTHYDDQFALWRRGEAIPLPWTEEEVIRGAVASLRLVPGERGPP